MRLPPIPLAALALVAHFAPAGATTYTFTTIMVPSAVPITSTVVSGINDVGQIVGTYVPAGSTARGFIEDLSSGTVTTFYDPAAQGTVGSGINNAGQVVGTMFSGAVPLPVGYLRNPVTGQFSMVDVGFPNPLGAYSNDINNLGQIIGYYPQALSIPRDQIFMTAGTVGGAGIFQSTFPSSYIDGYGLNDLGQVVGAVVSPTSPTTATIGGFVGTPGTNTYSRISVPGATTTMAYGINNIGQIVGSSKTGAVTSAFLLDLSTGIYTTLTDPAGTSTIAYGIDNAGQIVGSFIDSNGTRDGFIATPTDIAAVPEPASLSLLGGGVGALALTRRWKRDARLALAAR